MTPKEFKQIRQNLKLSQKQLAKELGLDGKHADVYIRRIEIGKVKPSGLIVKCLELYYNNEK